MAGRKGGRLVSETQFAWLVRSAPSPRPHISFDAALRSSCIRQLHSECRNIAGSQGASNDGGWAKRAKEARRGKNPLALSETQRSRSLAIERSYLPAEQPGKEAPATVGLYGTRVERISMRTSME